MVLINLFKWLKSEPLLNRTGSLLRIFFLPYNTQPGIILLQRRIHDWSSQQHLHLFFFNLTSQIEHLSDILFKCTVFTAVWGLHHGIIWCIWSLTWQIMSPPGGSWHYLTHARARKRFHSAGIHHQGRGDRKQSPLTMHMHYANGVIRFMQAGKKADFRLWVSISSFM